jgi:hypothetical protein
LVVPKEVLWSRYSPGLKNGTKYKTTFDALMLDEKDSSSDNHFHSW